MKRFKKFMAGLCTVAMLSSVLPVSAAEALAEIYQDEEALRNELKNAADEGLYPNGLFEFLPANMNTSESIPYVEFAIVRKGGTEGKAGVTFKAIDVTAKYGEDYTISVQTGIFMHTLPANKEAQPLIESFENVETNVLDETSEDDADVNEESSEDDADVNEELSEDEDYGEEATVEFTELPNPQIVENGGLRAERDIATGTTSTRRVWRETDAAAMTAAVTAQKEIYEKIPGVTYRFEFEDGEYIKKIRFNTIDDDISEDDEQVIFALLDATNGSLGENSVGFMNIEDNNEKERIEFEIDEKQLSVSRSVGNGIGKAVITVRRTSGLYRYGSIFVGTIAGTAKPDTDYEPVSTELRFVPGQQEQKLAVTIYENESEGDVGFAIKLDPDSPNLAEGGNIQTIVTIKSPQSSDKGLMTPFSNVLSLADATPLDVETSRVTENYNGKTYIVETISPQSLLPTNAFTMQGGNGVVAVNYKSSPAIKSVNLAVDLTEVEYIKPNLSSVSSRFSNTPWWINIPSITFVGTGGFDLDNPSHDKLTFFNSAYGYKLLEKSGDFSVNTMIQLNNRDNTKNNIYFAIYGNTAYYNSELRIGPTKLYKRTHTVMLKELPSDPDAGIVPKVWTTATTSVNGAYKHVGGLSFVAEPDTNIRAFGVNETVSLMPKYAEGIDTSKVYLWGYKIEKVNKGGAVSYYRVSGDQLDLQKLYTNGLTDANGETIKISDVLMANDTIVLLPIYKQRNAYVQINYDTSNGMTEGNAFPNGQVMHIGKYDTLNLRIVSKGQTAVAGMEVLHTNSTLVPVIRFSITKGLYINYVYSSADIPSAATERTLEPLPLSVAVDFMNNNTYLRDFTPPAETMINPAMPGELEFSPSKLYTKLTAKFDLSHMRFKIDPYSGDQDKGTIVYIPKEGDAVYKNSENILEIKPIERNKLYAVSGIPDEGYRIVWKDFSGDIDEDGWFSEVEKKNIEKYENSFDRTPVSGSIFPYVPNYDFPFIMYGFEPKPTGGASRIGGRVFLDSRDILSGSSTKVSLPDAEVMVNGHTLELDENGRFELSHIDFQTSTQYGITVRYNNINYIGRIQSNIFSEITINEYDTFVPHDFVIYDSSGKKVDPKVIDNRPENFTFKFGVTTNKQGIIPAKAYIRIYNRDGTQQGDTIQVVPNGLMFSFTINPEKLGVTHGSRMSVQIEDQNELAYLEHNVGFIFKKYLSTFNLLNSFKTPLSPAVDLVGKVDAAFDLGLAGKADKYMQKSDNEWIIAFGFKDDWSKSMTDESGDEDKDGSRDNPKVEKMKDAAASGDEAKMDKAVKDATATDPKKEKKNTSKVTTDMSFGISTTLYLRMRVNNDENDKDFGNAYFEQMFMSATLRGDYSKKLERMTPIGVTVYVKLALRGTVTGILVIDQYDEKKFYFDGDGKIDFSSAKSNDPNRDFTIYGTLFVQPYIKITAGGTVAGADLHIDGDATFDFNFTTSGSGSGSVRLTSKITLECLVFSYSWKVADKSWELFNYGHMGFLEENLFGDSNYLYHSAEDYSVVSRDYLNNRGAWQSGGGALRTMSADNVALISNNEQTLKTGVYRYPYTLLATIGEDRQLLVFIDDNGGSDDYNSIHLFYSVYNGTQWSIPQNVDDNNSPDGLPWICDIGDRVIVAWSDTADEIEHGDMVMSVLNNRDIKVRFFDKLSGTFGDVQNVTEETGDGISDSEPYIAFHKGETAAEDKLMIVYKRTEYGLGLTFGEEAAIGDIIKPYYTLNYRFYDSASGTWGVTPSGEELTGHGFVDIAKYAAVDDSALLDPSTGEWARKPFASEVVMRDMPYNDPLITDYNVTDYGEYAVLAYAVDMDCDETTTSDRELFLQLYNFKTDTFYPALRCTDDKAWLYNLEFVKAADTLYLYYGSNGDIKALDVGYILSEGLLEYEISVSGTPREVVVLDETLSTRILPVTVVQQDSPVDEFMVKADNESLYVVWGENNVSYREGIDPNSNAAALPQNHYSEKHIYAARMTIEDVTETPILDEEGQQMFYLETDEHGQVIDYEEVKDANGETGVVSAGMPIVIRQRKTVWTNPVKLTEGKGANYNDIDFEILSNGGLRTVFVKGQSGYVDVEGVTLVREDRNTRALMTADFEVSTKSAEVSISPVGNPKPNEYTPIELSVQNLALSSLNDATLYVYCVYEGEEQVEIEIDTIVLTLRGGEKKDLSFLWRAPENLEGITIRAVLEDGDYELCGAETTLEVKSEVDVTEANVVFIGRNVMAISGTAVNNGNISSDDAEVLVEASGVVLGNVDLGGIKLGEEKYFSLSVDVTPDMFETTENDDGSVTDTLRLSVHSPDGTGVVVTAERRASEYDIALIDNVDSFTLTQGGVEIPADIQMRLLNTMNIIPSITYATDEFEKPRVVYVSSDEDVVSVEGGIVTALSRGTANVTAYLLPPMSSIILSENSFAKTENLTALAEAAVKSQSFTVEVTGSSTRTSSQTSQTSAEGKTTVDAWTVTINTKSDNTGKASANVTAGQISESILKAANQGKTGAAAVQIKVETPEDVKTVEVTLSSLLKNIMSDIESLTILSPVAKVAFDKKSLEDILVQAQEDITITFKRVETSSLSEETAKLAGERPVFDINVVSGDREITRFDGNVFVSVPYTPGANEDTDAIVVYCINDDGKAEIVTSCLYDFETGMVNFAANHFSRYAVGYNKISFGDVSEDMWYGKAVSFIASRGITVGTGDGNFSPNAQLTRGQLITLLMRAYGIAPDEDTTDSFADAGDTYYTGYLATAKRLGISAGVGGNLFAPEKEITRQEMFVLLYNTLNTIGRLPKGNSGKTLSDFHDSSLINPWAKEAMTLLVETGTVNGSDERLFPTDTTTRAEMAQTLYNLILILI